MIGVSSIFKLTRRAAALAKLLPIFALSCPMGERTIQPSLFIMNREEELFIMNR